MAEFLPALGYSSPNEGGYVNNPNDKGGPTNWGITQAKAQEYGWTDDMRTMPKEFADQIYQLEYWPGLDAVNDQAVASKIFDMRINFGVAGGNKLAQRAANTLVEPATAEDGAWGPDTLSSVNAADPAAMLQALADVSEQHYRAIAANDPSQVTFLQGWINRARRLPGFAMGAGGLLLLLAVGALIWMNQRGRGA